MLRFLQATMELIDRQQYISWKLPKNWHIFLTSNPAGGDYIVNEMDTAMKTRYSSVELIFNKEDWASWAEKQGIDGRCINFILLNPEVVEKAGVNPRSLVTFFNNISGIEDFNSQLGFIQQLGESSIGQEVASIFTLFINNKLDKLIEPESLMFKNIDYVTGILKTCIGSANLGTYRADIASTLCTRIINFSIKYSKDNKIEKEYIDRIEELVMGDYFGSDLNLKMIVDIYTSNSQKFKLITTRKILNKHIIEE